MDVYKWVLDKRDDSTLETLANIKRFNETLVGDKGFLIRLMQAPGDAGEIVRERGIDLDPHALSPVWEEGLRVNFADLDRDGQFPLIGLWTDWIKDLKQFRALLRTLGEADCPDSRFSRWRKRQMVRADSELGDLEKIIPHPAVSFELSKGCTRGCWFCGLNAESFKGYLPYTPENADLWRGVLNAFREHFGDLIQTGFCYWATEPTDNPDYIHFIKDFYDIAGIFPQTTFSAPLKDLEWTRELLELHRSYRSIPCRFSVLDLPTLHKLHESFTPRELLSTEMVIQIKGSIVKKAKAGRIRHLEEEEGEVSKSLGTIACVSGFLVNMVERSLQLVSPCAASEKWPLGYRVHACETFGDAHEFREKILKVTEECMGEKAEKNRPVRFRKDLEFERFSDGFVLKNRFKSYSFKKEEVWGPVGDLVMEGSSVRDLLIDRLGEKGVDILTSMSAISTLVDKGLVDDEPALNISQ